VYVTLVGARYELIRPLGAGGMGVVHEAFDCVLRRRVAVKMLREAASDPGMRERFLREARAAAGVAHPNVCLLHEVGEHEGQPFLVMELLEGESLIDRMSRGPFSLAAALEIELPVLAALAALHASGLVHRDVKPSNIFLTPHGVKLLDFGLARAAGRDSSDTMTAVTMPGALSGTPQYMAPEQIAGDPLDARTDIFAAGIVLYELVTGRRPFNGSTMLEILNAVLHADPVPLGRGELTALDPIVRRALQRHPDDRYPTADAMAADLRPLVRAANAGVAVETPPPPAARVVVLPFRLLKPDDEIGFLESALPDAITASLAAVPSISVRSNVAALKFASSIDLARIAGDLDVDHVIAGTLLRSGDQIRVTSQLVETPSGRVRWSQTTQRTLGDLFELQDAISRHIVQSLPLDVAAASQEAADVPGTPRAYELYLRANEQALEGSGWPAARELYEQCVTEDPRFASAWARLGRVYRLIGKYFEADCRPLFQKAEEAFQRAFALNPDLSLAHHLYVYLEVETGRAAGAVTRLATRLQRQPHQAELYAALCHAARYCGLLEASLAAHERARALDPHVQTSVANTYMALQDYDGLLRNAQNAPPGMRAVARFERGAALDEVLALADEEFNRYEPGSAPALFGEALRASFRDDRDRLRQLCQQLMTMSRSYPDGEAIYSVARLLARAGWADLALQGLSEAVAAGFFAAAAFERDPAMTPLHGTAAYRTILARARERSLAVDAAFEAAGGYRVLGIRPPSSGRSGANVSVAAQNPRRD